MLKRDKWRFAIGVCILLASSWQAEAQELTVDGNVTATSFTGNGSNLTSVSADLHHGYFETSCNASATCFVFKACPGGFEVTGGGLFIRVEAPATATDRALVTLHQSYRMTATQWGVEATNGSPRPLFFGVTVECARVPPEPLAPAAAMLPSDLPPGLELSRVLLMCPESDTARFVEPQAARGSHFCPNHGLALEPSGGGPSAAILPGLEP